MRQSKPITIPGAPSAERGQRDGGKTFIVTEMPADQAERFCAKVALLIAEAVGQQAPENPSSAALAGMGINSSDVRVAYALTDPELNAQIWPCVKYQHRAGQPLQDIVEGENSPIEEITTRARLRMEVLQLHLGFSRAGESQPTSAPSQPSTA